ncbi:hypothetical protein PanWU01x14_108470 [Parasponia andersonii]|uniref:Uncharacterized protein n=1 Tax=Parasponia andersonii TaxID=3476 RepID=A0A2P5D048_PARAD|nr:hypothetical protein PanWU01x14_108470 [Parasponia andersonii]
MTERKITRGGVLTKNKTEVERSDQFSSHLYLNVYSRHQTRRASLVERDDNEKCNMTWQFNEIFEVDMDIDGQLVLRPKSSSDSSNSESNLEQISGSDVKYNPENNLEGLVSLFGDITSSLNAVE